MGLRLLTLLLVEGLATLHEALLHFLQHHLQFLSPISLFLQLRIRLLNDLLLFGLLLHEALGR